MERRAFLKAVGATALLPSLPLPANRSELIIDGDPHPSVVEYTFYCDPAMSGDTNVISFWIDDGHGTLRHLSYEEWHRIFREGELR